MNRIHYAFLFGEGVTARLVALSTESNEDLVKHIKKVTGSYPSLSPHGVCGLNYEEWPDRPFIDIYMLTDRQVEEIDRTVRVHEKFGCFLLIFSIEGNLQNIVDLVENIETMRP